MKGDEMNNFENEVKSLIIKYQMDLETGMKPEHLAAYLDKCFRNLRDTLNMVLEDEA
jgi:hypothetical protein